MFERLQLLSKTPPSRDIASFHIKYSRSIQTFKNFRRAVALPAKGSARRGRICPLPSQPGHAWLAQHYRWGLGRAFDRKKGHSHVVVVEDDMVFSPDFLLFFQARP